MWQLHALQALDLARARDDDQRRKLALRHPGAIDEFTTYGFATSGKPSRAHRERAAETIDESSSVSWNPVRNWGAR
jgi:hypothetical protein